MELKDTLVWSYPRTPTGSLCLPNTYVTSSKEDKLSFLRMFPSLSDYSNDHLEPLFQKQCFDMKRIQVGKDPDTFDTIHISIKKHKDDKNTSEGFIPKQTSESNGMEIYMPIIPFKKEGPLSDSSFKPVELIEKRISCTSLPSLPDH